MEQWAIYDHILAWLKDEYSYSTQKWPNTETDKINVDEYIDWVNQYLHRAKVLGVENPLGKQALAKALRTLFAFTEQTIRKHGLLPSGGYPSGEIH